MRLVNVTTLLVI